MFGHWCEEEVISSHMYLLPLEGTVFPRRVNTYYGGCEGSVFVVEMGFELCSCQAVKRHNMTMVRLCV